LRLGQVLINLCGNAVKFTEQGQVELSLQCISSTQSDAMLQFTVRDSGIGIAPEVQPKLFEKFTQADQTTTRRFGGTGLGLAICKHLCSLMGGRIWLEESELGRGTTVCFTVRLQIAQDALLHQRQLVDQVGPLLKGVRVLLVDDNQVSLEILSEMLRFFQMDVVAVSSGPAVLAALEKPGSPCDLLLMDWRMPGMNGDEVARRVHGSAAIAHKPKIVVVTAYGREDVMRLCEQAGVDGFLVKPVTPSSMLDTILSVLGRRRILNDGESGKHKLPLGLSQTQLAGARLLLVEDNDINREFATELLRSEGIEVDEAVNGQEAVMKVQASSYDAVLMDIQMPVMDGLEAAQRIRAMAGQPNGAYFRDIPIIAMTALAMAKDADQSRAAGMNDHVTKPISPERLMATLSQWVRLPRQGMGFAPAQVARKNVELPDELLAASSLDAVEGVRRIGGNLDAYCRQLQRFRDHYPKAIEDLRAACQNQGVQVAEHLCHALRGVAGNLGAYLLYDKLKILESTLKQGRVPAPQDMDDAHALMVNVLRDIDAVLLSTMPAVAEKPQTLSTTEWQSLLQRLGHALDYDLGTADGLISQLRACTMKTAMESEVAELARLVDVFDIDAAQDLLKALQAKQLDRQHE
jgi:CheY-like chemotaxis protein